ncbi:hypothetical protein S40293_11391 [Stachybotrys chartarum IBT 40293]|nr:hypothetical protein S40293_11391 [Stachybotrys chartarum IBT 40293]KFA72123.1 hypothetical protein S40288_11580 [Stachybotrys chartarum IBT 40288]
MPQGGSMYAAAHGGQATKWRVEWCLAFAGVDASPDHGDTEDARMPPCLRPISSPAAGMWTGRSMICGRLAMALPVQVLQATAAPGR